MGGKSKDSNESADALRHLAEQQYTETQPLRTPLINRGTRFLTGNLDVTASPMWGSAKSGIEQSYGQARQNMLATAPRGGALYGSLADLEQARAHDLALSRGTIAEGELNRALQLGTWGAATGTQGLAAASQAQSQQLAAQSQAKGAKGQGLGSIAGAAIGAWFGGPAGAAAGGSAGGAAGSALSNSDRRLKRHIRRIGALLSGVPLYQYQYVWGGPMQIGVMADEVPWARVMGPSGYWLVDYAKVSRHG